MLPCITGSWQEAGGGLQLSTSGGYGLNREALQRENLMQESLGRAARTVNMVELGKSLNALDNPPVKALFVYNSNPAAICPNHNDVVRGLRRSDLFTVVHEQFLTDTTDYADIVLPATTQLEHFDLMRSYGHLYVVLNEPAIEPVGEAKSNNDVFRILAKEMGFDEQPLKDTDEELAQQMLNNKNPHLRGITLDRLRREGWVRLNIPDEYKPFAEGNFPSPSGKCEL